MSRASGRTSGPQADLSRFSMCRDDEDARVAKRGPRENERWKLTEYWSSTCCCGENKVCGWAIVQMDLGGVAAPWNFEHGQSRGSGGSQNREEG